MKTIKPLNLGLISRCFEYQTQAYFAISTLAFLDFKDQHLLPEAQLWNFVAKELGKDAAIDVGIPKSKGEILVQGSAFTPCGQEQETCHSAGARGLSAGCRATGSGDPL